MTKTDNNTIWLEADWPAPKHVRAGTSLRSDGVSNGAYAGLNLATHVDDDLQQVEKNRQKLIKRLNLITEPIWLQQVHGNYIVSLDSTEEKHPQADGSYTSKPHHICAVLTADCAPILFSDKSGQKVAAIHAGWRGICKGIVNKAVKLFANPTELLVWIGPCIEQEHYEVGRDMFSACLEYHGHTKQAFEQTDPDHWQCNLSGIVEIILRDIGVKEIFLSGLHTFTDAEHFYSYRRDGQTGRTASMIWME